MCSFQRRHDHLTSDLSLDVVIRAEEVAVAVDPDRDSTHVLGWKLQFVMALLKWTLPSSSTGTVTEPKPMDMLDASHWPLGKQVNRRPKSASVEFWSPLAARHQIPQEPLEEVDRLLAVNLSLPPERACISALGIKFSQLGHLLPTRHKAACLTFTCRMDAK